MNSQSVLCHPGRRTVATVVICGLVWLASGDPAPVGAQDLADPERLGPFPVGVTTMQLDDHDRQDPETGGPRSLLTEIWYPATDASRSLPRNRFSDFILRGVVPGSIAAAEAGLSYFKENFSIEEMDRTFENVAVRDARGRKGTFPLVVFSHGFSGARFNCVFFSEFLASHGFIVAAPDHTGNSGFTLLDGTVVKRGGERAQRSAADRPQDVSFLIDTFTKMTNGADSRFAGRVDVGSVGVSGMSMGAGTSKRVLDQDSRVKAAVMLAPGRNGGERSNFTTPIMMMIGTEDSTVGERGNARSRQYYEASRGPRYLVEIKDAGHFTFSSVEQYNPNYGNGIGRGMRITKPDEEVTYLSPAESHKIINAYALAFFGAYLRGQRGYTEFLGTNHYGNEIIYTTGGM